jgi:hypothetical protein
LTIICGSLGCDRLENGKFGDDRRSLQNQGFRSLKSLSQKKPTFEAFEQANGLASARYQALRDSGPNSANVPLNCEWTCESAERRP